MDGERKMGGETSEHDWTSAASISVSLDYTATCEPGDNITILGGMIKPYCAHIDCACWP